MSIVRSQSSVAYRVREVRDTCGVMGTPTQACVYRVKYHWDLVRRIAYSLQIRDPTGLYTVYTRGNVGLENPSWELSSHEY